MKTCQLSRGALAKETGVNAETIRYYEKAGLLPDPPRTSGGHRVYDEFHLRRLSFIRRCRELGFTLDEVRGLLKLVDGSGYTCSEVLERATAHLAMIRGKIRDLKRMEKSLRELSEQCTGDNVPECPIIDALWHA